MEYDSNELYLDIALCQKPIYDKDDSECEKLLEDVVEKYKHLVNLDKIKKEHLKMIGESSFDYHHVKIRFCVLLGYVVNHLMDHYMIHFKHG